MLRFNQKYTINTVSECWEWTAAKDNQGYGIFYTRDSLGKRKMVGAHRYSYIQHHDDIPNGLFVLHTCDNPSCVNPTHLFLGTHQDNMTDKVSKMRQAVVINVGNDSSQHILTNENVLWMRSQHYYPGCYKEWANKFGVHRDTIYQAYNGRYWKHLPLKEELLK